MLVRSVFGLRAVLGAVPAEIAVAVEVIVAAAVAVETRDPRTSRNSLTTKRRAWKSRASRV